MMDAGAPLRDRLDRLDRAAEAAQSFLGLQTAIAAFPVVGRYAEIVVPELALALEDAERAAHSALRGLPPATTLLDAIASIREVRGLEIRALGADRAPLLGEPDDVPTCRLLTKRVVLSRWKKPRDVAGPERFSGVVDMYNTKTGFIGPQKDIEIEEAFGENGRFWFSRKCVPRRFRNDDLCGAAVSFEVGFSKTGRLRAKNLWLERTSPFPEEEGEEDDLEREASAALARLWVRWTSTLESLGEERATALRAGIPPLPWRRPDGELPPTGSVRPEDGAVAGRRARERDGPGSRPAPEAPAAGRPTRARPDRERPAATR
eukprot:CAMPEP_0203883216 /NCGR_PEP_ID=MMETSP0359-20131031/27330_1 /ASSEMBLY_ACC=CAM_ASM_000338 /TAXON_ID=268821 /ORGANISM="Scrippsiella Hangoei, Strain SHTV-5" /LENGTH=318 /DNA_ID=CAMNT_0050803391 /DNA_START=1 /DNA_END=955 /DNA_ORIENTATION=+